MMGPDIKDLVLAPYFPAVANFVLGVCVTATCVKRGNWLLGTFIFATFFFAYTILPLLLLPDAKHYWYQNYRPAGLSTVATAFFFGVLLAATTSAPISATRSLLIRLPKAPFFALGLFAVCIPLAYWQQVVGSAGWGMSLAVKGMISALGMSVVALALTVLARNDRRRLQDNWQGVYGILFGTLALCTTIAFLEIALQDAWVANRFRDNLAEFRASSTFQNPNFFGVWVASIVVASSSAAVFKVRYLVHPILALSAVAIFLSGSRSALMLTLVCLTLPIALALYFKVSTRVGVVSLAGFLSYLAVIVAIAFIGGGPFMYPDASTSDFSGFYALALRFISLPIDIVGYIFGTGATHVEMSIRGRFTGGGVVDAGGAGGAVDNGYLALASDGGVGFFSAVCWALFLGSLMWAGLKRLALSPSQNGIYAVTALAYCILLGFTMQAYQAFPIWAFVALLLSLFYLWLISEDERPHT